MGALDPSFLHCAWREVIIPHIITKGGFAIKLHAYNTNHTSLGVYLHAILLTYGVENERSQKGFLSYSTYFRDF